VVKAKVVKAQLLKEQLLKEEENIEDIENKNSYYKLLNVI
jgi:hypothetical protein